MGNGVCQRNDSVSYPHRSLFARLDVRGAKCNVSTRPNGAVHKILASDIQLTVDVQSYLTKNDQNCEGRSDEGHNVPLRADAGDCWSYLDEHNNPLVTYSIYVTPVSEGDFNVTLYSDGHCKDIIGTVGPIAPDGLCIYSAVPAPHDFFRSYTFDPVNCECHLLNSVTWVGCPGSGVGPKGLVIQQLR